MFRLAHLSDLHLAPLPRATARQLLNQRVLGYLSWRRRRYRVHRREVLDALVADVQLQKPDHVAVTGDLVNISLPAEFVQAAGWLRVLGDPDWITVIPGNHDAYVEVKWREAWAHWADYMTGDDGRRDPKRAFPFVRRRAPVALIGLSTAVATAPTFATGRLGRRQLKALDETLAEVGADGCCTVILLHHPPVATMTDYRRRLTDGDAFCALIRKHPAHLVLCGHQHVFQVGEILTRNGPVPVVGAPSASLQGGERAHEGGYLVYDLVPETNGWQIDLELRRFDPEIGAFAQVFRRRISRRHDRAGIALEAAS